MNFRLLPFSLLIVALLLTVSFTSNATHLRAGQITVRHLFGFTYEIRVEVFTNTINTNVLFGGEDDWLDFGDGVRILVPETQNTLRPDLGEGIATASFTTTHT